MRNQTSFRLTTTLLPTDTTAKTTTVINKVDADGNQFYPTFTDETVVITNDDRTVMETTRASCTNWAITFSKRGLSDDATETTVDNRKLTWNPWSICFITLWAWDIVDTGDSLNWKWDQTYTGDATYDWYLISHKWVKYPSFTNLAALEAYDSPFAWMFAVLESDWELYRYNAVTEQWDIVTTSTPAQPEKASTVTIWIVRGATDAELSAWTGTGSDGELLVATPAQITWISLKSIVIDQRSTGAWHESGAESSISYTVTRSGFITVSWTEWITSESITNLNDSCNVVTYSWTANPERISGTRVYELTGSGYAGGGFSHKEIVAVQPWTFTAKMKLNADIPSSHNCEVYLWELFYFWY